MGLNVKKILISTVTGIALVVFCAGVVRAVFYVPSDEISLPQSASQNAKIETLNEILQTTPIKSSANKVLQQTPASLTIPSIGVNAKIQEVGITKVGNMATPSNFKDVGWYKYGGTLGSVGTAVIAGHVDNGIALPAVFYRLQDLQKGDDIYIQTKKNETLHYVVTETAEYDFNESADQVFKQSKEKLLKLITCTGTWIPQFKTHDKRLVVTAILVEE